MTRFVGTPLRGTEFSSASDEAISARVGTDSYPRIRIDAGGRITWASGSATGDTTLYRDSANVLKTDDVFQALSGVITLTTAGVPTVSIADGAIAVDTTNNEFYYRSGGQWIQVSVEIASINDITDVVITNPEEFQSLVYDGTNWVNKHASTVTYVRNAEATTLTTGTVVYLFGATGDHATVKRADNDSDTTSSKTVGLVAANIASAENGPVVTRGYVDGINLSSGYAAGDVLWLGEDGAFTKTKPSAPEHLVFIGVVVRATENGIIYVATQNGYELDELHDVSIVDRTSGDFLKYNGTLWVNDQINLGTDTVGDSDDVAEGTTNIYFTDARARTALLADNNGTANGIRLIAPNTGTVELISHEATRFVRVTSNATAGGGKIEIAGSTQVIAAPSIADPGHLSVAGSITVGGAIVFEGDTANDYETTLQVGDPTADRTITLPNATGTVALSGSIALGTDTTGGYVESLVAGTGITLTNNSGLEGATPTVALSSGVVTATGTFNSVTVDTYGRVTNGSSVPVVTTSDVGTVTSTMIANSTIVDGDISSTAAIALSKLSTTGAATGDLISFNGTSWATSAPAAPSSSITVSDTAPTPAEQGDLWYNSLTLDAYIYYSSAWIQLFNDEPLVSEIRDLIDVLITDETYGQVLVYNGTEWENTSLVGISASSDSNYTLVLTDMNKTVERNSSSANTLTVPLNSSVPFPVGTTISVYQYGSGKTQVVGISGVTIRSNPGFYLSAQYAVATLVKRAADEWILSGDLSAS
jgi:hypothetical protein